MKKRLLFLLLFGFISLTSCNCSGLTNDSVTLEKGVNISVSSNLVDSFLYKEKLPTLFFDCPNVSVSTPGTTSRVYFVNNDHYALSVAFGNHLKRYKDTGYIITSQVLQTYDSGKARFGREKLTLDAYDDYGKEQKYSSEYQMVGWSNDGTRYSYQFRSFVSNSIRYYSYRYTDNIAICLEESLMVVSIDGVNKLLLLPLPFETKYDVNGGLTEEALLAKDTYLDDTYYTFSYPQSLKDFTDEEKTNKVKEWYEKYCEGSQLEDGYYISYAGAKFKIDFNCTKINKTTNKNEIAFKLEYVSK